MRLFPLNLVFFPRAFLSLHIFEERYRKMMSFCLSNNANFGICLIREGDEVGGSAEPHKIGTEAKIITAERLPDGRYNIGVAGRRRFQILDLDRSLPYLQGQIQWLDEQAAEEEEILETRNMAQSLYLDYARRLKQTYRVSPDEKGVDDSPETLSWIIANTLQVELPEKQELLEIRNAQERLAKEIIILRKLTSTVTRYIW